MREVKPELNATAASLLGFLRPGPSSGYDLAARIEGSIGNFWNVTRSQIYRELRVLSEAGYVRVGDAGRRERRPYRLTAAGRRAFDACIAREPDHELIRFPLLLTLFFGDRLPPKLLARFLRAHRALHEARLATYRRQAEEIPADARYPGLTLRFGLMYEAMVLRWFDSLAADDVL